MTTVCRAQSSPAEAQGRGDNGRGGALTWRYDVCQGPVTLAEFDHDCRMTRWYVRGVGVAEGIGDVVAEVDVSGENPKPHYYLHNHRGDVLVVLNPDGAANSTFRYDAFGNYYQMTGPFTPRCTFSTKEYLPAAGLYLYQYRAYDPIAGRWTQRDPIDYQDSISLYQFCGNNPVNSIDILGLEVKATFNRKEGTLTVTDRDDPSKTVTAPAFSGNGQDKNNPESEGKPNKGPIPSGEYEMLDCAGSDSKYRIEAVDGTPNDTHDATHRNLFRLVNSAQSHCCIRVKKKEDWIKVKTVINGTTKSTAAVDSKRRGAKSETLVKYGTITVL